MSTQPRQPQGIPAGGQFRDKEHREADVALFSGPLPQPVLDAISEDSGIGAGDLERLRTAVTKAATSRHDAGFETVVAYWRDVELSCAHENHVSGYNIRRAAEHLLEASKTGTVTIKPRMRDYELEDMVASEMTPVDTAEWVTGRASHRISPVIGWLSMGGDAATNSQHIESFKHRIGLLGEDVARRFAHRPSPEAVEEAMHQEWHSDQCGCERPDDICHTYGEHWRGKWGIPNVHYVFEVMQRLENQSAAASPRPPAN